ncbi:hypothetical protein GCM10009430_22750 [Aquimarina litoralis]|uniref:Secretion system C-terminal sorting domain-containing protein n=2 Tax=Aquimarina litoralis TaxID=584605 RepID=A0ABN1IU82_9FLAO
MIYTSQTYSQTQIGEDIDGEDSVDLLGSATAISDDGTVVAVGVERNTGNGSNTGQAKVYQNINDQWVQMGSTLYGNEGDNFGNSVALSSDGSIVAVASRGINVYTRVFQYNGTDWVQLGADFEREVNDRFSTVIGLSLSSDGNRIAIGMPLNEDQGRYTGQVRIYEYINNDWVQIGQDINGKGTVSLIDERFGHSVSLSDDGNRVGVGAPGSGLAVGKVRVYEFDGMDWSQIGSDFGPGNQGGQSGATVSMSADGDRIAVSVPGTVLGAAYIYDYNGNQWVTSEIFDKTGNCKVSLSADGERLAISDFTYNWTGDGFNEGMYGNVRIYEYDHISQKWPLLGTEIIGEKSWDEFGSSVALSGDGTTVIAGAAYNDDNGLSNQGHARVFQFESNNLSIGEHTLETSISIYPNPVVDKLQVILQNGNNLEKITIYALDGKKILEVTKPSTSIDLQELPKGIYMLRMESNKEVSTQRIVRN